MSWFGFHVEAAQEPHWTLQLRRRLVRCHASKVAFVLIVNRINVTQGVIFVKSQLSDRTDLSSFRAFA